MNLFDILHVSSNYFYLIDTIKNIMKFQTNYNINEYEVACAQNFAVKIVNTD